MLSGSAAGAYRYDGHFKRVKSTVNGKTLYNVFDASGTLIHIDNVTDNQQTDLVGRVARITNNVVTYLHPDHLGSAQAGTNASGAIAWREQYTPFGEALQRPPANDDQAGYTGHIQDKATGLTYMQARYYDAALGRFLSVDPVGSSDYDLNLYTYAGNDPVDRTDPSGLESPCITLNTRCGMNGPPPSLDDIQNGLSAAGFAGPVGPFADAVNTVISAVRGKWGEAAINAAAIVPIAGDTVKGAKIGADVAKASKIDRAAFQAERKAYWKAEAKTSADNYSAANLERMKSGKAPIGSDGHPMELHHKNGTPEGGLEPMTRTEYRLGENYQKNHWWQFW